MSRMAGARRWIWNWGLACRKETRKQVSSQELTALKKLPDASWLGEVNAQMLQQSLRDLDRAFQNFFAGRARFPKFKSRKTDRPRFRIPQNVQIENGRVYVPKIGWIHVRQHGPIEGVVKSAAFKQDACGNWHVTLVSHFDTPVKGRWEKALPLLAMGSDENLQALARRGCHPGDPPGSW